MASTRSVPGTSRPNSSRICTPRGPTRSPHALSRGNEVLSTRATRAPPRARTRAATLPAGPDPTTTTSKRAPATRRLLYVRVRGTDPNRFARALFSGLPRRYDLLAEVLSMGQNGRWRREAVEHVVPVGPARVLDVATGTAGVALRVVERTSAHVSGVDLTEAMLRAGTEHVSRAVDLRPLPPLPPRLARADVEVGRDARRRRKGDEPGRGTGDVGNQGWLTSSAAPRSTPPGQAGGVTGGRSSIPRTRRGTSPT